MVLDFGIVGQAQDVLSSDYKSAGSHQVETLDIEVIESLNAYEEILVVPIDKTYYITGLIFTAGTATDGRLAAGGSGSEVDIMHFRVPGTTDTLYLPFITPIKISSGTRLSGYNNQVDDATITLIGWQE